MASEAERPDEALIDLEVRVAYQQRTIGELDALVRTLYSKVDALEKALAELRAGAAAAPAIGPANDPPPHY
jgi:uncharacterized coiled-coil protein SlyX